MDTEQRAQQILDRNFVALFSGSSLPAGKLPARLKIMNWGDNIARQDGRVYKVNAVTLASLPVNQSRLGFDTVQIDFVHQTVPGTPFYKTPPVKVAANKAAVEVVEGEGVFLSAIAWTKDGEEFAPGYPDVSATPFVDKAGNVLFIHSAALCPQGQVEGITLAATDALDSLKKNLAAGAASTGGGAALAEKAAEADTKINPKTPTQGTPDQMDYKKLLLTLCALPETATDEEINTALSALQGKLAKLDGMDPAEAKALAASVQGLGGRLDAIQRDEIVRTATAAGKVIPACALPDKDGKGGYPVEQLRALAAELPVTVPVGGHNVEGTLATLASSGVLATSGSEAAAIARNLGVDPEKMKKA